jgi:hypothetical protein
VPWIPILERLEGVIDVANLECSYFSEYLEREAFTALPASMELAAGIVDEAGYAIESPRKIRERRGRLDPRGGRGAAADLALVRLRPPPGARRAGAAGQGRAHGRGGADAVAVGSQAFPASRKARARRFGARASHASTTTSSSTSAAMSSNVTRIAG